MRYSADQKGKTRRKMIAAALECFRRAGYDGVGINGLAKATGMTSGAFYGHFKSKGEAFVAAMTAGMEEFREVLGRYQDSGGERWHEAFVDFYFARNMHTKLGETCTLPMLTPEAMRADEGTRRVYEEELQRIIEQLAGGLPAAEASEREADAMVLLALFNGGTSLARAVEDPMLRDRFAKVLRAAATRVAAGELR